MNGHRGWAGWAVLAFAAWLPALAGGGMKIYVDELDRPFFSRVTYGYDLEAVCTGNGTTACTNDNDCSGNGVCGVKVDALAPGTQNTVWDLVCAPNGSGVCQTHFWDFSGANPSHFGVVETSSTLVPVDATETCSSTQCGLNRPNVVLGREDRNFDKSLTGFRCTDGTTPCAIDADCPASTTCVRRGLCDNGSTVCTSDAGCAGIGTGDCDILNVTLNVTERQDNVQVCDNGAFCTGNPQCVGIGDGICKSGSNLWFRAAVRNELETGSLGQGESRLCYVDGGRREVALFRFLHQDAGGNYMQIGDKWTSRFNCEQNIFNHQCGDPCGAVTCLIKSGPCSGNCGQGPNQNFEAKQESEVVNEGQVQLPSGHVFDALVVRQNAEFCAFTSLFGGCSIAPTPVRTVIYLWEVPELGTIARLMSIQLACDTQSFTALAETDIKFGLFPPLSLSVTGVSDTSVSLSWDPGSDTHRIGSAAGNYHVYWGIDSGAYAFDSLNQPGQASIIGTTATISGLTPSTPYFFTVTAMSDYTDPASCLYDVCETTTYESLLFPKQVTGGPVPLPIEVQATTAGGSGAVPDGGARPGVPLRLGKSGTQVSLTWGGSCSAGDDDYEVYEGAQGSFASHAPRACTTGGITSTQLVPASGSAYYLVVPTNGLAEGSYGLDSSGSERPASASDCLTQTLSGPVCP